MKVDGFYFGPDRFAARDTVRGGGDDVDQVGLDGHGGALLLDTRVDVEVLAALGGPPGSPITYGTITAVPAFQRSVAVSTPLTVDGSRESDGNLVILGGGDEVLVGGPGPADRRRWRSHLLLQRRGGLDRAWVRPDRPRPR